MRCQIAGELTRVSHSSASIIRAVLNDQGANMALSQSAHSKRNAVVGAYPHHVAALGPQKVGNQR
jgi:hypothetical protein